MVNRFLVPSKWGRMPGLPFGEDRASFWLSAQIHVVRLGWFHSHVEIAGIMFFMIAIVAA